LFVDLFLPFLLKGSTKEFSALNSLSFDLKKGESLGIIGMNGAGKSTLLQILAGVMRPSSGNVMVEGQVAALLELGSGFNPDFTGKENVYLNAALFGLSKIEIDLKFESILKFSEIEDFMYQPVKTYSSGMVLRLAFSVLVHVNAEVLIIDEALAVGDIKFTQKCMDFILNFKNKGTLILVTHDHVAVQSLCDKCLWLESGKKKDFGSTKEVIQKYLWNILKDRSKKSSLRNVNNKNYNKKRAEILTVKLLDSKGQSIHLIRGEEKVKLSVDFQVPNLTNNLVIGFIVKNKHGLELFSKNTSSKTSHSRLNCKVGYIYSAEFYFDMPVLQQGEYTASVAIAEQSPDGIFNFLNWAEGVIKFESNTLDSYTGLVGIPIETMIKSRAK